MGERPAGSDDAWKWAIRNRIWAFLEENDIARFPRPVKNRIQSTAYKKMTKNWTGFFFLFFMVLLSNFDGAPKTGDAVAKLQEYQKAQIMPVRL